MRYNLLILFLILMRCAPSVQSSANSSSNPKALLFTDHTYEEQIRTVQLFPASSDAEAALDPPVRPLGISNLLLQFDDLNTQRDTYYAKIMHCNYDWSKSTLMDLNFMNEYNEFPINNFEYSTDTHLPYVHYWWQVPPVKLPGNYLIVVYRNTNKDDLILTKRFIVFDKQVILGGERSLIGAGEIARMNQQLNFTVNYKNLEVINPLENIKVVIRQNYRWDNMASDLRPSFVREIEKQMEYRFFDDAKMFKGENEFRFFDMRSLLSPGRNVASVDRTVKPHEVYVQPDKPRGSEVYGQYLDMNGGYILANFDYRDASFSNYAYVNFTLLSKKKIDGDVYVTGGFHQWNYDTENLMKYDTLRKEYYARVLLKQGWYDYQYVVKSATLPRYFLEGSHFETENVYEIFVYYRSLQPNADLLVGYQRVAKNSR
jgi:hypothetical protein